MRACGPTLLHRFSLSSTFPSVLTATEVLLIHRNWGFRRGLGALTSLHCGSGLGPAVPFLTVMAAGFVDNGGAVFSLLAVHRMYHVNLNRHGTRDKMLLANIWYIGTGIHIIRVHTCMSFSPRFVLSMGYILDRGSFGSLVL